MIKAVIIDDEPFAVENIQLLLQENFNNIQIVGTANSIEDGRTALKTLNPNLLFLDIEMPFGTGFDLLDHFPERNFQVIFITAYNQYAVKAFRCSATDYLLKPIDIEEFKEAVSKAIDGINEDMNTRYNLLFDHIKGKPKRIAFPTHQGIEFISYEDIVRVEADRSYAWLHMKEGKKMLVSKSLREIEDMLPEHIFFRPHKSHLICLDFVKRFIRVENAIEMEDGSIVELSRRKKEIFLSLMC